MLKGRRISKKRGFNIVLQNASDLLIRSESEKEMIEELCKIISQERTFLYTVIWLKMPDNSLRIAAHSGVEETDLKSEIEAAANKSVEKQEIVSHEIRGKHASIVSIPLIYNNNLYGVFCVCVSRKVPNKAEIRNLKNLALNLSRKIAFLREKQYYEKMKNAESYLLNLAVSEMDECEIISRALNEVVRLTGSNFGIFGEIYNKNVKIKACSGFKDKCIEHESHILLKTWIEAIRKKQVVIINKPSEQENSPPPGHIDLLNYMVIPVLEGERKFVLILGNRDGGYSKEDAEFVVILLSQLQKVLKKKREEEFQKIILQHTGTAVMIVEKDLDITYLNSEAENIFAATRDEIIGKGWQKFVSKDDLERILRYHKLRMIDPSLAPRSYEISILDGKGRKRRLLLNVTLIPETTKTIVSIMDVSELRKAERAMVESEEKYRMIFENSLDAIVLSGIDMRIIDCNEAALKLANKKKEEVIGKKFTELGVIDEEDLPFFIEQFYRGVQGEKSFLEAKIRVDGQIKWIEISSVLVEREGRPYGFLSIIRDVTKRKEYEKKIEEMFLRLKVLHEIDKGLLAGKSLKELSNVALEELLELTGADGAALFEYNAEKMVLELMAATPNFRKCDILSPSNIRDFGLLMKGEIIGISDLLMQNDLTETEKEMLKLGMRSYLHIPLIARQEFIGILCLFSRKPEAFMEVSHLIDEISSQLSIALHEAILFEMRKRAFEQIEENIEKFAVLVDHLRNPLAAISGYIETMVEDQKLAQKLGIQVKRIEEVIESFDKGWLESETIREFLKRTWK
jgi:PAS domain S-box-containing protein